MSRLWDKGEGTDELVLRFAVGDDHVLDRRLVPYDVRASKAHAEMLASCGYLTEEEAGKLCAALDAIGEAHARGEWEITVEEEDVHTALENRLTEALGDLGEKIHLGRSRNDQVLTALRLYLRDVCGAVREGASAVAGTLDSLAKEQGAVPLPGYTHMQPAMPSSVSLWAAGFAAELLHSAETLNAAEGLLALNPLGSAAGYGAPGLPLDRDKTTQALDFIAPQEPVTAAQLSRGKAEAAVAFSLTLILQDLGRLAADLCLFATREFGLVRLPERFTTGSSVMPQKHNPDVFELVRAHSAQAASELTATLAVPAKMPSGYHRDLQLIKAPLFRLIDTTLACLSVMARAVGEVRFDAERAKSLMTPDLDAASEAFRLVREEGLTFREAYRRVAARFREP